MQLLLEQLLLLLLPLLAGVMRWSFLADGECSAAAVPAPVATVVSLTKYIRKERSLQAPPPPSLQGTIFAQAMR